MAGPEDKILFREEFGEPKGHTRRLFSPPPVEAFGEGPGNLSPCPAPQPPLYTGERRPRIPD